MQKTDDYHAQAQSWAVDTRVLAARSRRAAWIIAGIAVAVALFEAVALAMLAPLKTVQPVTLLVDRQTGFVQALDPLTPRRVEADAALTQSFLAQYVTAREGFDRAVAAIDYRKVALWSTQRARSAYVATMPASNPASPFQLYPAGTTVAVRVKSVSRLAQDTALVRFDTQRQDRNGRAEAPRPWISVIRYRYVDAAMSMEDRLVNPLGFQVWSYRRDAEAVPVPSTPAAVQPVATSAAPATPLYPSAATLPTARPATSSPRRQTPVRLVADASGMASGADRREVPINRIPLGSPLVGLR